MNTVLLQLGLRYLIARLGEASTWASIAALIAGWAHIPVTKSYSHAFLAFGLSFAALLGILLKGKGNS
jgi:hypothetical protein